MARKVRLSGINPNIQETGIVSQGAQQEEEVSIFDEDENMEVQEPKADEKYKVLVREVNGDENRKIRVGRDADGHKYRKTDDTQEELVVKTTTGKNTYLTKAEFDRQVKTMLMVDEVPQGIKAEFREGNIVFINEATGLTMSASELRTDPRIMAAQDQKRINDKFTEYNQGVSIAELTAPDITGPMILDVKPIVTTIEVSEKPKIDESSLKINPAWYTSEGAKLLEQEWGSIAPKSRGFNSKFYQGIVDISKEILCDPNDLMALINAESSFIPNQRTGLMGFVRITQDKYSFTPSKLSPVKQLPYIRKCLIDNKEMAFGKDSNHALSAGELYSVIFVPGYVKGAMKDPKHILVSKRSNNPQKRRFYNNPVNINLDRGRKGYITMEDLAQRLEIKNAYNTSKKMGIAYHGAWNRFNLTPDSDEMLLAKLEDNQIAPQALNTEAAEPEPSSLAEFNEPAIEELKEEYPNLIQEVTVMGSLAKVKKRNLLTKAKSHNPTQKT